MRLIPAPQTGEFYFDRSGENSSDVDNCYACYLELGCVSKLHAELIARAILSKRRVSRRRSASGGVAYSRGALYALLKNRLYRGEIVYRGEIYRGSHEPIIEPAL